MFNISNQFVHFQSSEDMSLIPDKSIDFFITSPPYWNLKDYGDIRQIGESSYEEYLDRLSVVWEQCFQKGKTSSVLVINVNTRRVNKSYYPISFDIVSRMKKWIFWDHIIWYVPNALPQPNFYREKLLDNKFESCLVFIKDKNLSYKFHKPRVPQKYQFADPREYKKNPKGRCLGNIIRIPAYRPPNVKELGYHVSAYPEELVAFFLECYTDENDIVLDPFLGSGTTLKVTNIMRRKGVGFEINEESKDLIEKKIKEPWKVPDWRTVDIMHSITMEPGMSEERKIQYLRNANDNKGGQLSFNLTNPSPATTEP